MAEILVKCNRHLLKKECDHCGSLLGFFKNELTEKSISSGMYTFKHYELTCPNCQSIIKIEKSEFKNERWEYL